MIFLFFFSYFIFPENLIKLNIPGEPELPVLRIFTSDTSQLKINIIYKDSVLKDKILPAQFPIRKGGFRRDFVISETYGKDTFFPDKNFEIIKIGRIDKKDIYLVEIYTHRYNPAKNILLYPKKLVIEGIKPLRFKKSKNMILYVLNDSFFRKLRKLIIYRRLQGYNIDTLIVNPSTDTSTIRNLINIKDPDFVIILGDISLIKTFISRGDYDFSTLYTDLFFGVSDTGFLPERITGRISVKDTFELENVIEKIIGFETSHNDYLNKGYFVSSDDYWYHQLTEQTHRYSIDTLRNREYICDSLWGYYKTGTPIDSAFNTGRNIIVYSGHGSEFGWLGPIFSISKLDSIKKIDNYGFVFNFACKTGNFSYPECFTEALLRRKSKGAVFTFGASTYSYWEEDDILQKRIIDLYKKQEIIGNVIDSARILFLQYYGVIPLTKQYFKEYNIFGDPLIKIRDGKEIPIISNIPKFFPRTCTLSLLVEDKTGGIPFKIGFEQNFLFSFDSGTGKIDLDFSYFDTGYVNYYLSSSSNHIPIFSKFKLIPDGIYLKTDTFFISYDTLKINLRNFGNKTFKNGCVLLNPITQDISFETDSFFLDSVKSFNYKTIETRFTLSTPDESTGISVVILSDSFSNVDTIFFNLFMHDFEILKDTLSLYKNRKNNFLFSIKNTSRFSAKNILIRLHGNDIVQFDSSVFFIDSLSFSSSSSIVTSLFVKETELDTIGISISISCANYYEIFNFVFNLKDENLIPPHYLLSSISKGDVVFLTDAKNVFYDINLKYYDVAGRKVRDVNLPCIGNFIDRTNFKPGIYFIHYTSYQNKWIKKIIILK